MLKFIFSILFLSALCNYAVAQGENPSDNKNIGLCGIYTDTISLEDLKSCELITIKSTTNTIVTSYTLSFYLENNMNLIVIHEFSNKISKEGMEKLLSIKPKKIFIEEVLGEGDTGIMILGHRNIYIK